MRINKIEVPNYEDVRQCFDEETGLHSIIAIHNTTLGKALGGTRLWPFENESEALKDVLRLSQGMTRKAAMADLASGGGKGVIIANQNQKTEKLLIAYAKFVNSFDGLFLTGEDVGISQIDVVTMRAETPHIFGIRDPSIFTAAGVFRSIKKCAKYLYGNGDLRNRTIAIQGVGHVGYNLALDLLAEGAHLVITDIDKGLAERVADKLEIPNVEPERIFSVKCDIFVPCALGGILNKETIPKLKCKIVAGAANNQLAEESDGYELLKRDILYVPDYVINAGGLISVYMEKMGMFEFPAIHHRVSKIAETVEKIITIAKECNEPPQITADRMADTKIRLAADAQNRSYWI